MQYSRSVPPDLVSDAAQLLDEAALLRDLIVPCLGDTLSGMRADLVRERARSTGDLAQKLVKNAEVAPERQAALNDARPRRRFIRPRRGLL